MEQGLVTVVYIKKCKIVLNGTNVEFEFEYHMVEQNNSHILASEDSESDFGILFRANIINLDEHIDNTVNKVNRLIGLIYRKFTFIDISLSLYTIILILIFYLTMNKYE